MVQALREKVADDQAKLQSDIKQYGDNSAQAQADRAALKADHEHAQDLRKDVRVDSATAKTARDMKTDQKQVVPQLIRCMRFTGLAIGDAVTLEREKIRWDASRNFWRVVTSRAKTGVDVSVPLPPDVAEELLAVANGNPRYVFWNNTGGQPETAAKNWSTELRAVFIEAGLPTGHSHQLRDTAAVEWLRAGIPAGGSFEAARPRLNPHDGKTLCPVGQVASGPAGRSRDGDVEEPKGLAGGSVRLAVIW